jgi:chromosome segregation ATPase
MKAVTFAEAQRIGVEKRAAFEAAKQETINQEKNKLISEINSLKTMLSQKDLDITKKSEIINNLQKNVLALKDNTINQLNQNITERNNIITTKDNQISNLTVQLTNTSSTLVAKNNEINSLTNILSVKDKEISALKVNIVDKDNEIKAFKASVVDKDREILNLSSENDKLNNLVKEKNQIIEELNLKIIENRDILNSKEDELLKYIEDEFVGIDINEQEGLVMLGDSE